MRAPEAIEKAKKARIGTCLKQALWTMRERGCPGKLGRILMLS